MNWVLWKDGQRHWALGGPRAFRGEHGGSKVRGRAAWVLGRRREMLRPPWGLPLHGWHGPWARSARRLVGGLRGAHFCSSLCRERVPQ